MFELSDVGKNAGGAGPRQSLVGGGGDQDSLFVHANPILKVFFNSYK